ncbi:4Fe-4S binding protein [Hyperthermus butylicus]|uniref:Polyferredoxin n=1 Tax=Hyperthermus butylicus (strain DSM 5456 / JCM 9403 / PLM1-5) TaxID=415426 RepID=A2BMJ5_HYPBU|nr:4Fe-4S binding protein [Hyperthermus butylicus]ABM81206.1 Polyferredoxin [Hyperthermus butylicus DSM 5456]
MRARSSFAHKLKLAIRGVPPRGKYTIARRALQLAILTLFSTQLLVSGAILMGSLASSRILRTIPLMDPFAWLEQTAAAHGPAPESIVAVLIVVAIYSVLGRFFCGWVCPMDLLFSLFERKLAGPRAPPQSRPHMAGKVEKMIPLAMMAVYIVLSVRLGQPFFTTYSPVAGATKLGSAIVKILFNIPGAAIGSIMAWATITGFALIVNIAAEHVFGVKRLWCRYICPIGNLYGYVMNRYSPLVLKVRHADQCRGCMLCSMVCPMGIDVAKYVGEGRDVRDYRCFHCGRCAEVCPWGVLSLGFAPPRARKA